MECCGGMTVEGSAAPTGQKERRSVAAERIQDIDGQSKAANEVGRQECSA
jgi:hypothetical protein